MSTGSDIVLWEDLNNATLYSRLDNVLAYTGLDILKHPAQFLPSCLLLVFVSVCFSALSRTQKKHDVHTRAALQALLAIVAPTCSFWPSRYIGLARALRSHIDIPLEMIVADVTNGVIEFRDPVHDLEYLIGSGVSIDGLAIRVVIGWRWWINYFDWWILVKVRICIGRFDSVRVFRLPDNSSPRLSNYVLGNLPDRVNENSSSDNSRPLESFPTPSVSYASNSFPTFCLDHLPHDIAPLLNANRKMTLEFTAFSPSLPTLSRARIISAVPFILSKHLLRRPRSLVSVLEQLSASYGRSLVFHSVSNISVDYEHKLRDVYESFSGRQTRDKRLGIETWRREMFVTAFEVALLRRGLIERWVVRVIVK